VEHFNALIYFFMVLIYQVFVSAKRIKNFHCVLAILHVLPTKPLIGILVCNTNGNSSVPIVVPLLDGWLLESFCIVSLAACLRFCHGNYRKFTCLTVRNRQIEIKKCINIFRRTRNRSRCKRMVPFAWCINV